MSKTIDIASFTNKSWKKILPLTIIINIIMFIPICIFNILIVFGRFFEWLKNSINRRIVIIKCWIMYWLNYESNKKHFIEDTIQIEE